MTSTSISLRDFFAVEGTRFSQKDAQAIGPVLSRLEESDTIAPREVLQEAKNKASPIHRYFEWNDSVAADLYRLDQAKDMLRSVKVHVRDRAPDEGRALEVVRAPALPVEVNRAKSVSSVSRATSQASEMADRAYSEISQWKRRYESYASAWKEFGDVFVSLVNQIGEFEQTVVVGKTEVRTHNAMRDLLAWRARHGEAASAWEGWDEQMTYLLEAIAATEDKLCAANEEALPQVRCSQCGTPFTPRHERHRLCEKC